MAIRGDFSVDYTQNPRIITIAKPSINCSMQDLHDTLSYMQSQFNAIDEPKLVASSGKEVLDTTNKVGITTTLQDAQVGFEARDGTEFGGTNEWTQCFFDGGNLVSVDTSTTPPTPIISTSNNPFVNLTTTKSSSATLQEQDALNYSSYGSVVSVNVNATNEYASGTAYPSGNMQYPVDNIPNAVFIAWDKGLDTLQLRGNHSLVLGDNPTNLKLRGQNKILTILHVDADADVLRCEFSRMTISGTLDGDSIIEKCSIKGLNYVNGEVINCTLQEEPIVLGGSKEARFIDCYSGVSGTDTSKIDMNGTGQSLLMRNFSGGTRILNRTGSDPVSLDFLSGHCIIDSTCTGDAITVRGTCKLTVEVGATTPNIEGKSLMVQDDLAGQVWNVELP